MKQGNQKMCDDCSERSDRVVSMRVAVSSCASAIVAGLSGSV